MQIGGALTVGNAFRVASGAAGIANTGSSIFCRFRPVIVRWAIGEQRFVGNHPWVIHTRGIIRNNEVLNLGYQGQHRQQNGCQSAIDDQKAIARMINNISDVLWRQSAINRMQHCTH